MIEKINKAISKHCIKPDVLPLIAVLMNCMFIMIYINEYQLQHISLISNIGIAIYVFCIVGIISYILKINYFPIIWFISVLFGLGFFSLFTVFITFGKKYLVINLSSSLLLLAMIVDWFLFIIISALGALLAYVVFAIVSSSHDLFALHPSKKLYLLSYLVLYTFLSIALFMKQKEKVQAKKMDFMKVFGSAIAHEVNAPLASITMISNVFDTIISTMQVKKNKNDQYLITLDKMDYEMLTDTINNGLKKSSNDATQIVEMLLSALRDKYTNNKILCNIGVVVKDAMNMATYFNTNNKRITLNIIQDFEIKCSQKLMKHVIYNLIKNAFKHGGSNVNVSITVSNYQIVVSDNGIGIKEEILNTIFDTFTTNGNGSGIGLAFCKFVLDEINAKISCQSEVGKYTSFIIDFDIRQTC